MVSGQATTLIAPPAWDEILEPHGWRLHPSSNGKAHWTRPRKDTRRGYSATTGYCRSETSGDLLYVFSCSAPPFEPGRAYSRFTAYALLNHQGDFAAAAADLASRGYGSSSGERPCGSGTTPKEEEAKREAEPLQPYEPFPIAALPGLLAEYVTAAAEAIGCDPVLVTLPVLSATAGAIGNTRAVLLKSSWLEPSVLWTAPTAQSGGWKSPAFHRVLNPVAAHQARRLAEFREKHRAWEKARQEYEDRVADSRRKQGPRPQRPEGEEPRPAEYLVDDITTESLALKLRDNPRGLLGAPEELSGYFGAMDAYKKAHVDAARYLRMYDAKWVKVDRKTGDKKDRIIFVRRAAISITGTIQTGILALCASPEHFANGMMARFIIAQPPLTRPEWSEAEIPAALEARFAALLERLYELQGLREEGEEHLDEKDVQSMCPRALYLTPMPRRDGSSSTTSSGSRKTQRMSSSPPCGRKRSAVLHGSHWFTTW